MSKTPLKIKLKGSMASTVADNLGELEKKLDEIRNGNRSDRIHLQSLNLVLANLKNKETRLKTETWERGWLLDRFENLDQRWNDERHYNKNLNRLLFEYNSFVRLSGADSHKRDKNIEYHLKSLTGFQKEINLQKKRRDSLMTVQKYTKLQKQESDITRELQQLVNRYDYEHDKNLKTCGNLDDITNKLILRLVISANKIKNKMAIGSEIVVSLSKDGSQIQSNRSKQKYQLVPINIHKLEKFNVPEIPSLVEFRGCEQNMTTMSYTKRVIQVTNVSTVRISPPTQGHPIQNDDEIAYEVSSVEITEVRNGRREYVENSGCINKPSPSGKDDLQIGNNPTENRSSTSTGAPSRFISTLAQNFSSRGGLNGRGILKQAPQKSMFSTPTGNIPSHPISIAHHPHIRATSGTHVPINESKVTVLSNVLVKGMDNKTSNFDKQASGCIHKETTPKMSQKAINKKYSKSPQYVLAAKSEPELQSHADFIRQMNTKQTTSRLVVAKETRTETAEPNISDLPGSHITIESSNENMRQTDEQLLQTFPPLHAAPVSNEIFFNKLNKSPAPNSIKRKAAAQNCDDEDDFDFYNLNTPKKSKGDRLEENDFFNFEDILNSPPVGDTEIKNDTPNNDFFHMNSPDAHGNEGDQNLFDVSEFLAI